MQIGLVIVGGMTFGTLLTLFVLPTVYTLVSRPRHLLHDEAEAPAGAHGAT
jgi:multidrug efflux pump